MNGQKLEARLEGRLEAQDPGRTSVCVSVQHSPTYWQVIAGRRTDGTRIFVRRGKRTVVAIDAATGRRHLGAHRADEVRA